MIEVLALASIGLVAGVAGLLAGRHSQVFAVLTASGTVASFVVSILPRQWTESQLEHRILTSSPKEAVWGVFVILTLAWLLVLAGDWVVRERVRASIRR